ncbi:MAG: hypothetical protein NTX51_13825 [Verrucomicrobia bacterium]|nr:hypothetical protein [Verrucomicrobiota bacterium]
MKTKASLLTPQLAGHCQVKAGRLVSRISFSAGEVTINAGSMLLVRVGALTVKW